MPLIKEVDEILSEEEKIKTEDFVKKEDKIILNQIFNDKIDFNEIRNNIRRQQRKSLLPYALPLITILIIAIFAFKAPGGATGFAVKDMQSIDANIKVTTSSKTFLPKDTIVQVSLDGEEKEMLLDDFVKKTGQKFETNENGYTGDYVYSLPLSSFDITNVKTGNNHELIVRLIYHNRILSETKQTLK